MPRLICSFIVLFLTVLFAGLLTAAERDPVAIVVDRPLTGPATGGLAELERVLAAKGWKTERQATMPVEQTAIVVGLAGSPSVEKLLAHHEIVLPKEPESLCIQRFDTNPQAVLLIAGRDARGLNYALRDVARAMELVPADADPGEAITPALESPALRVRSVSIHTFNADLERDWYFNEEHWKRYFSLLARSRYNNLILTFSDQTNYLCPIYAYVAEVPGYPAVRVKGLSAADRQRNLAMLRRIGELAHEHGLDFTLGIWMQMPVPKYVGEVLVEGLPEGVAAGEYCAAGLRLVLKECPAIDGVQFRMNDEAGVHPHEQLAFYRPLFQALANCGRPLKVDLRYKGVLPETIDAATGLGLDLTISTKFWCEHFGLPYHPTVADTHYRASRYGYGTLLAHQRKYRVVYQLWTVGSQRLLLWGDPTYAARFAESCRLGGGEGFEVFAPLTDKGFGNAPGHWPIFANPAYRTGDWEFERYWFFHLSFGRLGYNPQTDPEIWRREFRARFGPAAEHVEAAYRHASQIIPLITATRLPSASEWSWWPEMDTGDRLAEYMVTPPSDTAQFYAIRTFKRTPKWRTEAWDAVPGYVEDAVAGRLRPKTTPLDISRHLLKLANQTEAAVAQAQSKVPNQQSAEFRSTILDLHVLSQLAGYHAAKTGAAIDLAFFEVAQDAARLPRALNQMQAAANFWEEIVRLTDGVYHDNLVFGHTPKSNRPQGHHHSGHWKDRLAELQDDVKLLEQLVAQHGGQGQPIRKYPGEEVPRAVWPGIAHTPPTTAVRSDADLPLALTVESSSPVTKVSVHFRPLNNILPWKELPLEKTADGRFQITLSSHEVLGGWDFQYYFEVQTALGGRLWPAWAVGQPYYVVKVIDVKP